MRHALAALVLPLPTLLACPGDDQGGTGASTTHAGTSGGTSAPATTGGEASSTGPGGATTSAGASSTAADGDGTTAAGPNPLDACLATCQRLEECMIEEVPNCGIPCSGVPTMVAGCSDEYVAQQECVVALSCDELQAWVDAMVQPGTHPCEDQDDAYQACQTGATT